MTKAEKRKAELSRYMGETHSAMREGKKLTAKETSEYEAKRAELRTLVERGMFARV